MKSTDLDPVRHDQISLFLVDLTVMPLKEFIPHLEHPFFGLSKRPRKEMLRYEDGRGNWLELRPDPEYGLPTIFDQDLVIYAASAILAERRAGRDIPRRLKFRTADLIEFSNRQFGGRQYLQVEAALQRLTLTNLRTNIVGEKYERTSMFGMVDRSSIIRRRDLDPGDPAALLGCEIVLSDWMIEAILANQVLTLHPDYFRLRRPFDRRIYQIARKHCGRQPSWKIALAQLYAKSGSTSPLRRFRQQYKSFCDRWCQNAEHDGIGPFLDYTPSYDAARDVAVFRRRSRMLDAPGLPLPDGRTEAAFAAEFAGLDLATMQKIWRTWSEGKAPPHDPEAAFLGFCRSWRNRRDEGAKRDAAAAAGAMMPGDPIHPDALAWWQGRPAEFRIAREKDYRICGEGEDWAFIRTDKQLIERVYEDWTGRDLPD